MEVISRVSIPKICYFVRENPKNADILAIATVDGHLLFLNVLTGSVISGIKPIVWFTHSVYQVFVTLEKHLSAAVNDLLFSDDGNRVAWIAIDLFQFLGKTLALLDDTGSVTFYSSGYMSCDNSTLKILPDGYDPKNFLNHSKLRNLLKPPTATLKRYVQKEMYLISDFILNFYFIRKREAQPGEEKKKAKLVTKAVVEEVQELDHLPYWSSVYVNQSQPFVPQLGDVVIYFFKPHLDFLKRNGRKLKEIIDYEDLLPHGKPYLEGIIESIEYIPAELVKCSIALKVMIGRKNFRLKFNYFFGIPQPNYLVLKSAFSCNLDQRFKTNETVKILAPPCQGETGIILDIVSNDPSDTFHAYKILW